MEVITKIFSCQKLTRTKIINKYQAFYGDYFPIFFRVIQNQDREAMQGLNSSCIQLPMQFQSKWKHLTNDH